MLDPDYELFASIVKAGSLTGAARGNRMSPAMVSKRLARLEARLGVQLVHRSTRRLFVTDIGKVFNNDITAILSAVSAAETRVTATKEAVGDLRISAPTSFGRLYVAPYIAAYVDENPRVNVHLELSDAFVDLVKDRFDLAIRISPAEPAGVGSYFLGQSHRALCASPAYLAAHPAPTSIAELRKHALLAADGQLPWRLDGPDGPMIIHGRSRIQTTSSEVVRVLALSGAGIALRSLWDVNTDIQAGRLKLVLEEYRGTKDASIRLIYPKATHQTMAASAFIEHLKACYGASPPWS